MRFPFFGRKKNASAQKIPVPVLLTPARAAPAPLHPQTPKPEDLQGCEWQLYDALRTAVPVIDAAIRKIVRLAGGFTLTCPDPAAQEKLTRFAQEVPVNGAGASLQLFADQMLGSLLTYGNAVGELLCDSETGAVTGLLSAHPSAVSIRTDRPGQCTFLRRDAGRLIPFPHPEHLLFAALDPPAGQVLGTSVLKGLPDLSQVLLRIYDCIGKNYERAGNVRYAVTYQPDADAAGFAKEHAEEIAKAWKEGITAAQYGEVQDFVAVGNIGIKVIGAENPLFDTNVPVRQLLEQIISKLSIPPFLLGFSWATTERMSAQQADILTSELEAFRRVLTPMLRRIGTAYLRGEGCGLQADVQWDFINLQDETALAEARLKNAQAAEIERRLAAAQAADA